MKVTLELTGTTPLVHHNIRLADPGDEFVKAIHAFTKKRIKTDEDRAEIERLEWYGGLYANADGPIMPTQNVRKCIINAAKAKRQGKAVERALIMLTIESPLDYEGPRNLDALWADTRFRYRAMVGVTGSRLVRVRPQFQPWAVSVDCELLTDVLDVSDLADLASTAGLMEGLGDNRTNGYGRFQAVVK